MWVSGILSVGITSMFRIKLIEPLSNFCCNSIVGTSAVFTFYSNNLWADLNRFATNGNFGAFSAK